MKTVQGRQIVHRTRVRISTVFLDIAGASSLFGQSERRCIIIRYLDGISSSTLATIKSWRYIVLLRSAPVLSLCSNDGNQSEQQAKLKAKKSRSGDHFCHVFFNNELARRGGSNFKGDQRPTIDPLIRALRSHFLRFYLVYFSTE